MLKIQAFSRRWKTTFCTNRGIFKISSVHAYAINFNKFTSLIAKYPSQSQSAHCFATCQLLRTCIHYERRESLKHFQSILQSRAGSRSSRRPTCASIKNHQKISKKSMQISLGCALFSLRASASLLQ
jgi:hypothetical protein